MSTITVYEQEDYSRMTIDELTELIDKLVDLRDSKISDELVELRFQQANIAMRIRNLEELQS